jgi:hypothetical protein
MASSSPGWTGEVARKDRGLTLDRLLAKVGSEAASPDAGDGAALEHPLRPGLDGDGAA